MRGSSHLLKKQVASFQHQTYVGIFIEHVIRKVIDFTDFSDNMLYLFQKNRQNMLICTTKQR